MKVSKQPPMVRVTWMDITCWNYGWQSIEDLEKLEPAINESLGFMLVKNKNYVKLAASYSQLDGDMIQPIVIPTGCILMIEQIKFKRGKK